MMSKVKRLHVTAGALVSAYALTGCASVSEEVASQRMEHAGIIAEYLPYDIPILPSDVYDLQIGLQTLGCNPGEPDGVVGESTLKALKFFVESNADFFESAGVTPETAKINPEMAKAVRGAAQQGLRRQDKRMEHTVVGAVRSVSRLSKLKAPAYNFKSCKYAASIEIR